MKSTYINLIGYANYPRLFEFNKDMAEWNQSFEGLYSMDFYPQDEAEWERAWKTLEKKTMQGDRDKDGNPDLGTGKYLKLKRKHKDPSGIEDFSGPPEVVHWTDDDRKGTLFDPEVDGLIGNGSKVLVKLNVYGEGTRQGVRLMKVGVMELVPYEPGERF